MTVSPSDTTRPKKHRFARILLLGIIIGTGLATFLGYMFFYRNHLDISSTRLVENQECQILHEGLNKWVIIPNAQGRITLLEEKLAPENQYADETKSTVWIFEKGSLRLAQVLPVNDRCYVRTDGESQLVLRTLPGNTHETYRLDRDADDRPVLHFVE